MQFEVEHEGKKFLLEAPSLEEGVKALQPYIGGGMQQAAQPGMGTDQEQPASEGRWAPNPLKMAYNAPSDAMEIGSGIAQTVAHPIETAQNVYNMGWDGFKDMVYSQYGTWDNFVNYMEKHPLSFGMDAAMVGGPATMGLKATGMAGKAGMVGRAATAATKVAEGAAKLDPFAAAAKAGAIGAKTTGKIVSGGLGFTTGTDLAVENAAKAGYHGALSSETAGKVLDKADQYLPGTAAAKGTDAGKAFLGQYKGFEDADATVDKAREVMASEKTRRSIQHNKAKEPILADPTPLDIAPIENAILKAVGSPSVVATGTGKSIKSASVPNQTLKKVLETVNYYKKGGVRPSGTVPVKTKGAKAKTRKMEWKDLPDASDTWKMNTFDQMRNDIGEIYGSMKYDDPARSKVGQVYYAITDEIDNSYTAALKAAGSPNTSKYREILAASRQAQKDAEEIAKTFSLKEGTAKDTALRKLHSAMRPNIAHGNIGGRSALAQALVDMGHKNLMYELAGAHSRPLLKNSLMATGASVGGASLAASGSISTHFLPLLVAFSPKVIGGAAYASGKVAGSIIKPAVAIERALRRKLNRPLAKKVGRAGAQKIEKAVGKTAQYGTAQTGRMAEVGRNKEELKTSLMEEAQKSGLQVHDRVLNNLAEQIMSDDPDSYLQGVKVVGRNPRLLKLFLDMGTKGEQ